MPKDHYVTLGVQPNATIAEIKSAYRQRALELHPDRSGAEGGPFREVQEAYQVLGNPASRRTYDQGRRNQTLATERRFPAVPEPLRSPARQPTPIAPHPYSRPFLDHVADSGNTARTLEPLVFNVRLPRRAALAGGQIRLQIPLEVPCPACRGRGGYSHFHCVRCAGTGAVMIGAGITVDYPPGILSTHLVRVPVSLPWGSGAHIIVRFQVF